MRGLDCVNANVFRRARGGWNDGWTEVGSCGPTFVRWRVRGLLRAVGVRLRSPEHAMS